MVEAMLWGVLRVAATLLLLTGIGLALRGASAATRHAMWRAGFLVALVLPVASLALPWRLEMLPGPVEVVEATPSLATEGVGSSGAAGLVVEPAAPTPGTPAEEQAPARDAAIAGHGGVDARDATPVGDGEPLSSPSMNTEDVAAARGWHRADLARVLLFVWLAGALLLALRLVVGHVAVRRIVRGGRRLESASWTAPLYEAADIVDVAVDVDLVASERVTMPFTAGVRRPVIVMPESAESWDLERRRAVLMHELAHVRRGDLFPHHVARWVCALHWFNPLAWLAARRMRAESERAADDLVLAAGTRASDYADHLLQIVSSAGRQAMPAPALPLAQRREFEGRMLAILEPGLRRGAPNRLQTLAVTVLVLALALPVAALDREDAVVLTDAAPDVAEELASRDARRGDDGRDAETSDAEASSDTETSQENAFDFDALPESFRLGFEVVVPPAPVVSPPGPVAPRQPKKHMLDEIVHDAMTAAGQAGEELSGDALPALVNTLEQGADELRETVVAALGDMDDPRAVQALIRILREDSVAEVRAAAAWALGEIEDPAAVPALSIALRNDRSAEVRRNAAWALGQIEHSSGVEALGVALHDSDIEVRRTAMWALGEIEDPAAVPALIAALDADDPEVRHTAAWALGQIEDARAVDGLVRALRSSDPDMRQTAARALGEIESPAAVQGLMSLVSDDNADVREAALFALVQIESPEATGAYIAALSDENPDVRTMAAHSLGEVDLSSAPPELIRALRDSDADVRTAAAHALGEIADPASIPGLTALLEDANDDVVMAAIHALLEMDDDVATEALLQLLQHRDPQIRKHAAEALGH